MWNKKNTATQQNYFCSLTFNLIPSSFLIKIFFAISRHFFLNVVLKVNVFFIHMKEKAVFDLLIRIIFILFAKMFISNKKFHAERRFSSSCFRLYLRIHKMDVCIAKIYFVKHIFKYNTTSFTSRWCQVCRHYNL